MVRQHTAPQAQVYRAKLAVLLRAHPTVDNPTAARQLGKHENWVRYWRRIWATEGFRLADNPGRGRKPVFSPSGRGHGQGAGLRTARPAR
jgi:transposase